MRILWVKPGGLWPLNSGGRLRSFHIVSELARRHRVVLLTTHGPNDDLNGLRSGLPLCEQIMSLPYAPPKYGSFSFAGALSRSWLSSLPVDLWKWDIPQLRREVRRFCSQDNFDLCVADFLVAFPNILVGGPVPVVFFAHNVEHMIWKRLSETEGRTWRRPLLEVEWRKMRRYEARACAAAGMTLAVSETDRALLAVHAPGARICTIPTGVDTSFFSPNGGRKSNLHLVFTGSMDWYPNEDGMLYFIETVLPRVRAEIPHVSFSVVGRNPSPRLRAVGESAGVRVTGTVDDVRPYIAEGAVYVVPLRIGGGTRLKIFEALAMGKAVVATSVGAEGLPLVPGIHFLDADDPQSFARAVVSLLRDPVRQKALGMAGRRLVEERYSWREVAREFEARCEEVIENAC